MTEKITKTYRVTRATAKALHLLAVQSDLPLGDLFTALLRLQKAGKYITQSEDQARVENMWAQAILSTKRAGHSGWTGKNEEPGVVIIDEDYNAE